MNNEQTSLIITKNTATYQYKGHTQLHIYISNFHVCKLTAIYLLQINTVSNACIQKYNKCSDIKLAPNCYQWTSIEQNSHHKVCM